MTEQRASSGYFKRLISSLLGREAGPSPATEAGVAEADLRAQVAGLRLDLEEREKRIEAMQHEYSALKIAKEKAAGEGGQEVLDRLFKKLAGPMSNIAALADLGKAGREISATDLLGLFQSLEKDLAHAGLERVGKAGESTSFDSALHQRMSGGTVHAGTQVVVRIPGYRRGEKVLLKAMVSTREGN